MAKPIELATLAEIDGTWAKSHIASGTKTRLSDLHLIERRSWPNGPLWRTASGDRCVREAKRPTPWVGCGKCTIAIRLALTATSLWPAELSGCRCFSLASPKP